MATAEFYDAEKIDELLSGKQSNNLLAGQTFDLSDMDSQAAALAAVVQAMGGTATGI